MTAPASAPYELILLKIPVKDIKAAAAFYRDTLGLKEEFVAEEYGWAQFSSGDLPIALYLPGKGGGNRTPGGSVDFNLATKDAKSLHASLTAKKAPVTPLSKGDDNSLTFEVTDPSGNILRLIQPAPQP